MSGKKILFLSILTMLFFSGCTRMLAVGEVETYCNSDKYNDLGYCDEPYNIYTNRKEIEALNKQKLEGIRCSKR